MIDIVVNKLKTGGWKNVVPFGYLLPPAPYIVVKEEPTEFGYSRWRIIGHIAPGNKNAGTQPDILGLRLYMQKTVYSLLNKKILSSNGRNLYLRCLLNKSNVVTNSDGTLSIESIYRQETVPL